MRESNDHLREEVRVRRQWRVRRKATGVPLSQLLGTILRVREIGGGTYVLKLLPTKQ